MNGIPPGGLVPEEPLTRPSAARRGAKAAAGADKVSLMIALEDEVEAGELSEGALEKSTPGAVTLEASASGAIMLEDADEGEDEPPAHQAEAVATAQIHDREQAWTDATADRLDAAAVPSPEPVGPDGSPAAEKEIGAPSKASAAAPREGAPGSTPGQSAEQAFATRPEAGADRAAQPAAPAARSRQAPSPGDASESPGQTRLPHDPGAQSHHPRQSHADDAWQEPKPGFAKAGMQRPGSQREDSDRQGTERQDAEWQGTGRQGTERQDTRRQSPWASGGPNAHDHAASEGWDRPPPPPRHAPRAPSLPAASLGMPAQLSGIEVTLSVEIGSHRLSLRDLLSVEPGQLVPLDRMTSEPVDILVNGKPFARGEVVAIGDRFGVRLTELVDGSDAG